MAEGEAVAVEGVEAVVIPMLRMRDGNIGSKGEEGCACRLLILKFMCLGIF